MFRVLEECVCVYVCVMAVLEYLDLTKINIQQFDDVLLSTTSHR